VFAGLTRAEMEMASRDAVQGVQACEDNEHGGPKNEIAVVWTEPPPLAGVKSKKRTVLSLALQTCVQGAVEVNLSSRAAVSGLSALHVAALFNELSSLGLGEEPAGVVWNLRHHDALKVALLHGDLLLEEQLASAAASTPHVLVVDSDTLKDNAWSAIRSFPGALVVVEGISASRHFCALGIATRWRAVDASKEEGGPVIASEPMRALLHDVQIRDDGSAMSGGLLVPGLDSLVEEQLSPLYLEEFGADVGNLSKTQAGYDLLLSLLVEPQPAGEAPELLGFLAYKPWASPRPGVSIAAVGVTNKRRGSGFGRQLMDAAMAEAAAAAQASGEQGHVYLRSLPTAVKFYLRLGYLPVLEVGTGAELTFTPASLEEVAPDLFDAEGEVDEDSPCVPMIIPCSCTYSEPAPGVSQPKPWSPRRARHLEDGPTWLPVADLLAKVAA